MLSTGKFAADVDRTVGDELAPQASIEATAEGAYELPFGVT
jgi:hypothetical protein